MAGWDGNGTFSRTYNWTDDKTNGIKITAARHDQNDTDFVNGVNNCLTKDGQNSPSANLPMATYKHTGVGKATALDQYATAEQVIDNELTYYTASGTDTYTITPSPAVTSYAAGQSWLVKFTNANTGAATLNVNSLGAKSIVDRSGTALAAGAIPASAVVQCDYDGTNFVITPVVIPASGLANNAVTTNKILDAAVTYAKIQDVTATSRLLGRRSSGSGDVEECTIEQALNFISSLAQGDTLYHNGTNFVRLAAGTSGHYLKTNGTGANPEWAAVSSGALVKISSQTASSSASIEFTGLSSTYRKYIVEIDDLVPASASQLYARVNTGGGYISTSTYDQGGAGRDSEGNPIGAEAENAAQLQLTAGDSISTTSTNTNNVYLEIINPSHSSKRTSIRWRGEWAQDGTTRFRNVNAQGSNQTTSAVTAIEFLMSTGNIASGTFTLYGVLP